MCGGRGEKRRSKKRKFLRSCPWQTRSGRAACGVVSPSWPTRSTWPVPPGSMHATGDTHTETQKILVFISNHHTLGLCRPLIFTVSGGFHELASKMKSHF